MGASTKDRRQSGEVCLPESCSSLNIDRKNRLGLNGSPASHAAGHAHTLFRGNLRRQRNSESAKQFPADYAPLFSRCSILAHVSFKATVRLKTSFSGVESGSTQK